MKWKTSFAVLPAQTLYRAVGLPDQHAWRLHERYRLTSPVATTKITTETTLGTLGFACMEAAGLTIDRLSKPFQQIMRMALLTLALKPATWSVEGDADQNAEFVAWLTGGTDHAVRRRAQEMLGIQERKASRYLICWEGAEPHVTDDLDEIAGGMAPPVSTIIDGVSLASALLAQRPDTLFYAEPLNTRS